MYYRMLFWLIICLHGRQAQAQHSASLNGTWTGAVQLGAGTLPVRLTIPPAGAMPTVDLPTQGPQHVQADALKQSGDSMQFVWRAVGAVYKARLLTNPRRLSGFWTMQGTRFPLSLQPLEANAKTILRRVQEPQGALPYQESNVCFAGGAPGILLSGTITAPPDRGRGPAVLLISGSGPHDRDGLSFDHKPLKVLADHLTRLGYTVLRFDERGVGESTGQFWHARTKDFAADAAAALQVLRKHPKVDRKQIYLLGHSQGTFITAMLAAQEHTVAGLIQLAGVGTSGLKLWQSNYQAMVRSQGLPKPPEEQPYVEAIMEAAAASPDSIAAVQRMQQQLRTLTQNSDEINQAIAYFAPAYLEPTVHDILSFDPTPYLHQVKAPVLVITGENDQQAPAPAQHAAFATALPRGGRGQLTTVVLPGVNHFLQTILGPESIGYGASYTIPETISPKVTAEIDKWLGEQRSHKR